MLYRWRQERKRAAPTGACRKRYNDLKGAATNLASLCGLYAVSRGRQDGDNRAVAVGECRAGAFSRAHRKGQGSDSAAQEASETVRVGQKGEPRRSRPEHAEARERMELGSVVASGGGESRWGAGMQFGGGEAFDDAQPSAATRTEPA